MQLSNFNIRQKLTLLVMLLVIGILITSTLAFSFSQTDALESRKQQIKSIIQAVSGQISSLHQMNQSQQISDTDYQKLLKELIYQARYADGAYIYLMGSNSQVLIHPARPDLEGKYVGNLRGTPNIELIVEGFREVERSGARFWEINWPREGEATPIPKLTYAAPVAGTNMFLGTGIYLDDLDDFFWQRAGSYLAVTLAVLFASLFFATLISRNLVRPLGNLNTEMRRIARGDFDQEISSTQRSDELGQMARTLLFFRDQLIENNRLRHMQEHVKFLENFDPVTRLYNRQALGEIIEQEIVRNSEGPYHPVLLLIRLDLLRSLTIELGDSQRDHVLLTTSKRLRKVINQDHRLGRMGENSFGLLLMEVEAEQSIEGLLNEIINTLKIPIQLDSMQLQIGVRIGITRYPDDGDQQFELIGRAEIAAGTARRQEQDWLYFGNLHSVQQDQKMTLWQDLNKAIEQDHFYLVFQPLFDLRTNMLVSAEVLLRWKHPDLGEISPATFVPMAEQSGLISQLDNWVLRAVARQCRAWQDKQLQVPKIAINLSGISFLRPEFKQQLTSIFQQEDIPLSHIELELTEGVLIDDMSRIQEQLLSIRETGASISIDDFGTGYSSLSRIKNLPVDHLKIDRSFIEDIEESSENLKIVQAIMLMAHGLQLKVIAEGVETEAQLSILRNEHCDIVQGYLLSRPLPVDQFAALLDEDLIIEGD